MSTKKSNMASCKGITLKYKAKATALLNNHSQENLPSTSGVIGNQIMSPLVASNLRRRDHILQTAGHVNGDEIGQHNNKKLSFIYNPIINLNST